MRRPVATAVVAFAALSGAACASILGIHDGQLDPSLAEAGVQICESDSGVQVDTGQVFVSATLGKDAAGCGTDQSPCRSITAGIGALASTRDAHLIYVSDGDYLESIKVPVGIEIQGGWHVRGVTTLQWVQVCRGSLADISQLGRITGTDSITIHEEDLGGSATLTNLAVRPRAPKAGESVFGVVATGAATRLTLNQVLIEVGNGGDGTPGTNGDDGTPGTGTCTSDDGNDGTIGDAGSNAPGPTFSAIGVLPNAATAGEPGSPGHNGTAGRDGGCVACVKCTVASCNAPDTPACGGPGKAGCAGGGGRPGSPGQSGGSTIGIFAWGGAVIVNGGSVKAGNGGAGGAGGSGGNGGEGSKGEDGPDSAVCAITCAQAGVCIGNGTLASADGGAAGSSGGAGGNGGAGGAGAGGDAYGIYSGNDASILVDAGATLAAGAGGKGGEPSGVAGVAGARFP